ncbi:MAG: class C beta-lactamase-related serine hydrolase, partial [Acidobacteria bacterium]
MSEPIEPTLRRFLHRLVAAGEVTAAVALVAEGKEVLGWSAAGAVAPGEPEPPALTSRFDLASLTKPIMATLALILDRRGLLPLRARVGDVLPGVHPRLARRQLATLLRHRAGFVPWTLLARRCATPREVAAYLAAAPELLGAPPGTYSDLGYVLWGRLVETATGTPLARLLARHLAEPLAMTGLAASPAAGGDVVACGLDNGVEVELAAAQGLALAAERRWRRGEPQDANARFLGGLGGHAGLFGSAADLLRFARLWLDDGAGLLAGGRRRALAGGGPYALGWA